MPSAYIAAVLADSPVCYFKLDEDTPWHNCRAGSGRVLRPSHGDVGTRVAGAVPGSAAALRLNGTGELLLQDPLDGNSASGICIEAVVGRPPAITDGVIFNRGRDGRGQGWSVFFKAQSDGVLSCGAVTMSAGPAGYTAESAAGVVPVTGAAHAVMNFIPGAGLRLYANGALVASTNFTATSLRTSTFACAVGGKNTTSTPDFWAGTVDELAIYTTPLSEARIAAHYAAGALQALVARDAPEVEGRGGG